MKTLETRIASEIVKQARTEAGKAEFVTLVWHDGQLKLNDAGDIAIPSRSKASIALEMRWDDETLTNIVFGFVGAIR